MHCNYFADGSGGSLVYFLDCEIIGTTVKAAFAYWAAYQRGTVELTNEFGQSIVITIPAFVWELKNDEFLYKAEYPILRTVNHEN